MDFNQLGIFVILTLSSIVFMRAVNLAFGYYQIAKSRKNYSRLYRIDEKTTCKGPHNWFRAMLAMPPLPVDYHLLCRDCGVVSSTPYQLNKPGLVVLAGAIKHLAEKEVKASKKKARVDEIVNADKDMWIKTNIGSLGKDAEINTRILADFHIKTISSITAAVERADRELGED